ncbi:hypothetical protein Pan14r_19420 [Crateriforma conspicua]|uniref:Uncharacterized protein n=2 Tax=Crateriforma conspicua TaxID=2527996 RepID=A0A5C5Y8H4_9PLAN|nr:hypothetical protein Pan14r_19420 [Crateriforma conspicua]
MIRRHRKPPHKSDRVSRIAIGVLEAIGRIGRWALETALLCIAGFALAGAIHTVVAIIGAVAGLEQTFLDDRMSPDDLAAAGWWIGFAAGLFRLPANLRRPFGQQVDKSSEDSMQPSNVEDVHVEDMDHGQPSTTVWDRLRRLALGGLIGAGVGLMLAVYVCVLCTAVLLCPLAPASWNSSLVVVQADVADGRDHPHSPTASGNSDGSVQFWHPVYGSILFGCVGGGTIIGALAAAAMSPTSTRSDALTCME